MKDPSSMSPSLPQKKLIRLLVTGLYSGLTPVCPGTCGTVVALFLAGATFSIFPALNSGIFCILLNLIIVLGSVFVSNKALKYEIFIAGENKEDPGSFVIDEIAGYFIAIAFLPHDFFYYSLAFVLFRLFDITKPGPVRRVEHLPHGWGIVLDDVLAGVLTNILLQIFYFALMR